MKLASPANHTSNRTVLDLIDTIARSDGTAVALDGRGIRCTYDQLVSRSTAVARGIVSAGVERGDVVAVVGGRDVDTFVGMIAVLRAGAVVTMIDPTQRAERVRRVLERAAPALTIAVGGHEPSMRDAGSLLRPLHELEDQDAQVDLPRVAAEDPAYLCFTSGSIGEPTGVLGWHGALTHFCLWEQRALDIGPDDQVAQMAALSFDAVFKDVFPALIGGATVSLPPSDTPFRDLDEVVTWWNGKGVTVVQTVPSVLSAVLSVVPEGFRPGLRVVCLSGEPLDGALVNRWRAAVGDLGARVVNLYGTTEATILQAWHEVPAGPVAKGMLPVGRAIDGVDLLVVNRRGRRCGVGEPGEVLIRSPYLTRGAWRPGPEEPSIFEADPLVDPDGIDGPVFVQRTGDLGRIGPDGCLEIHGRADDQVKILGIRVQPAEVSALISQVDGVAQAAVTVQDGEQGPELAAYVVAVGGRRLGDRMIREFVAAHGSNAMVPAHVVMLDRLPLNVHGKVDRRALSRLESPPAADTVSQEEAAAPVSGVTEEWTETEQQVALIWSETFKRPMTDRDANFFELGGHSLMLARLLAAVRRRFDVQLSLPTMFAASTIASLAGAIDDVARGVPDQPEQTAATPQAREVMAPVAVDHRVSGEQEGLWFLQQLRETGSAYHMSGVFRLPADTEAGRVKAAYLEVCRRHEALRLRFFERDGQPRQQVGPAELDFRVLDETAVVAQALGVLGSESDRPFDLEVGPLVRVRLVRAPDEWLVGLTIHHLCCDGISWGLLAHEVDELLSSDHVKAASGSRFCELAERRADEAGGTAAAADLAYWVDVLADAPALELPAGRPTGSSRPRTSLVHRVRVPSMASRRLVSTAATASATEYMAWMGAVVAALAHTADVEDLTIGSDSDGREDAESDEVVGFFVRTHAYRFDLTSDPTFADVVGRVREGVVEASGHRAASYAGIVDAVARARGGDRRPLFSVMMRMPPRDGQPREATVLRTVDVVSEAGDGAGAAPTAKFSLTLVVRPDENGTTIDLEYDADVLQSELVEALGARLVQLAQFAAADPDRPLSQVGAVTHPLARTVGGAEPESAVQSFIDLARDHPTAEAVSWDKGSITYAELAEAVAGAQSQMAQHERVGIVGGKSPASVAALVGALAAGAVPVPLDETLPAARRTSLLERASVGQVVWTGEGDGGRESEADPEIIATFDSLRSAAPRPAVGPVDTRPTDPAYVFFTSGTTGEPKGVVGSRRGLDHFVAWEGETFDVVPGDRVAQITILSFDAVLRDVFVPLSRGASICLPPVAALDDPGLLLAWLEQQRVTIVHTTPSVVSSWLRTGDVERLSSVRLLCLAGEPLTGALVHRLRERLLPPNAEVVNFYGPTETTMIKSWWSVPQDQPDGPVAVGHPLPGAQVVVLGHHDRPCGPGQRGEVVIRTAYRTAGYLGDDATVSVFEPNPFGTSADDSIFRTGDNGYVGADGELWLEGRRDDMIKIRGVRVHPAEVAAALSSHADVAQVYVENGSDEDGLTAFVVRLDGTDPSTESVREHARRWLPTAMVPSLIVFVDAFALLPNGKLDRKALGDLVAPAVEARIEPRSELERSIWTTWTELLGHEEFGVSDDFFAVGGHSLLATILLTRLRKQTGVALTLRHMLEGPRVEQMAAVIEETSKDASATESSVALQLRAGTPEGPVLFLVHAVGGDVLCYRDLANALPDDVTVIGLRAGGLDSGRPGGSVQEMAAAFLHEVQRVQRSGHHHFAGWSMGGVIAYEMARQLSFEGAATVSVVLLDSYAPGSRAFEHFAGDRRVLAGSFARDLERVTGQVIDIDWLLDDLLHGDVNGGDTGTEIDELRRRFEVFEGNARALVGYRMRRASWSDTEFTLVLAADQVRPEGTDSTLGWERALGLPLHTEVVAGADHFTALQPPAVSVTAAAMAKAIRPSNGHGGEGR